MGKKKARLPFWGTGRKKKVRAALLSHALKRTIIAAGGLNGRVRDGNGCLTPANGTNQKEGSWPEGKGSSKSRTWALLSSGTLRGPLLGLSARPVSPLFREETRGGRRPGHTAYQKRYAERLAALVHPPCQAGSLPAAFRDLRHGTANLRGGLALRCLQRLSLRDVATRRCRWLDNRNTRGRPPPVLSY